MLFIPYCRPVWGHCLISHGQVFLKAACKNYSKLVSNHYIDCWLGLYRKASLYCLDIWHWNNIFVVHREDAFSNGKRETRNTACGRFIHVPYMTVCLCVWVICISYSIHVIFIHSLIIVLQCVLVMFIKHKSMFVPIYIIYIAHLRSVGHITCLLVGRST